MKTPALEDRIDLQCTEDAEVTQDRDKSRRLIRRCVPVLNMTREEGEMRILLLNLIVVTLYSKGLGSDIAPSLGLKSSTYTVTLLLISAFLYGGVLENKKVIHFEYNYVC